MPGNTTARLADQWTIKRAQLRQLWTQNNVGDILQQQVYCTSLPVSANACCLRAPRRCALLLLHAPLAQPAAPRPRALELVGARLRSCCSYCLMHLLHPLPLLPALLLLNVIQVGLEKRLVFLYARQLQLRWQKQPRPRGPQPWSAHSLNLDKLLHASRWCTERRLMRALASWQCVSLTV